MTYLTKLKTVLAPGCAVSRTGYRRSWVSPFHSSMAVGSSSTALVLYPTAGPSPLWVSQDTGLSGLQGKEPGLCAARGRGNGLHTLWPSRGPHSRPENRHTHREPSVRPSGVRNVTEAWRTIVITPEPCPSSLTCHSSVYLSEP